MARSHLYRPIQDAQGNLRTGARVRVFDVGSITATSIPLYASGTGSTTVLPVHSASNGIIDFYTDEPARFRIGIQVGDEPETIFENVDCLEPGYSLDDPISAPGHVHPEYYSATNPQPPPPGTGTQANQVTLTQPTLSTTLTDTDYVVFMDGTNLTVTVPTAVGRTGRIYIIKNLNLSPLTVATQGGTIDGDVTRTLAQFDSLTVISNGTNWSVV